MRRDLDQTLRTSPDVLIQEISGESVLLDLASEQYFGLNEVGTCIWSLLEANGSLQRVFDELQKKYAVDPDQLESDLLELIAELKAAGLVVPEIDAESESQS